MELKVGSLKILHFARSKIIRSQILTAEHCRYGTRDLATINATARMQAIRREELPPDLPTQRDERAGSLPPSMPARATMPH